MIGLFVNKSMRMRCRRVNQTNFVCIAFDNLTIPSIDIFDVWMKFRDGAATNIASYVAIGIEAFNFNSINHDFVFSAHSFVFISNSNRAAFYRFRNPFIGFRYCANLLFVSR